MQCRDLFRVVKYVELSCCLIYWLGSLVSNNLVSLNMPPVHVFARRCDLCGTKHIDNSSLSAHTNGKRHKHNLNLQTLERRNDLDQISVQNLELTFSNNASYAQVVEPTSIVFAPDHKEVTTDHVCILHGATTSTILATYDTQVLSDHGTEETKVSADQELDPERCIEIESLCADGTSIPHQVKEIKHCVYSEKPSMKLNLKGYEELTNSCVIMEGSAVIGILCHDYFPPKSCKDFFQSLHYLYEYGGIVPRGKARSGGNMIMCGWHHDKVLHKPRM